MTDRSKSVVDIREILMQLRAKVSQRKIAEEQQIHRKTVKRYEKWAKKEGLLTGELPELAELQALLKKRCRQTSRPIRYQVWNRIGKG